MVQLLSFIAFTTSYYGFLMHTFRIVSTNTAKPTFTIMTCQKYPACCFIRKPITMVETAMKIVLDKWMSRNTVFTLWGSLFASSAGSTIDILLYGQAIKKFDTHSSIICNFGSPFLFPHRVL